MMELKPLLVVFDLAKRMKSVKSSGFKKNNSNAICAACLHAPTNNRTKNAVALQKFLSRRRRKEDYACTQKKMVSTKKPALETKILNGILALTKKTCR